MAQSKASLFALWSFQTAEWNRSVLLLDVPAEISIRLVHPSGQSEMTFTYMLTMDDMVAYNLHIYGRTLANRARIAGVIISMMTAYLAWSILRFEPPPVPYVGAGAAAAFMFFVFTVLRARGLAQNVRRMFGSKPDPTTFGQHRVTLDREGVRIELQHASANYDWEIVGEVVETPLHVFVHIGPVRAIVIPLNESLIGASREEIVHAFRSARRPPADEFLT